MSEDTLETAYRVTYWQYNELQLISQDFNNLAIDHEMNKLSRRLESIYNHLGYVPAT